MGVIKKKAEEVAKNKIIGSLLAIGKTTVDIFSGTIGTLGYELTTQIVKLVLGKPFVPPIYDLIPIERGFDSIYYPERFARAG